MAPLVKIIPTVSLTLLLSILATQLLAARYDLVTINEPQINAINNIGTVVGVNADGKPYVWRRDQDDLSYPEETDVAEDDRIFRKLLPDPATTFTDIHVLDINNELEEGSGASIVGWYLDENGFSQSVLWYKKEEERKFSYTPIPLPPHKLVAGYCTNDPQTDFSKPECMSGDDAVLIYRATKCSINETWQTPNSIAVDKVFEYRETVNDDDPDNIIIIPAESPDCSNFIPICEAKAYKTLALDRKDVIQGEDGPTEVDAFDYEFNEEYLNQSCIIKEHAEIIVQAMQCDNSNFKDPGDAIVTKCDPSSQATAINNDNTIIGVSIKDDGSNRPVFWVKGEGLSEDGDPVYKSGDLGTFREAFDTATGEKVDPKLIPDENSDLSINVVTTYRPGFPTAIDKTQNSVVGLLRLDGPDSALTPTYWTGISAESFDIPEQLKSPRPETLINEVCNESVTTIETFNTSVTPTNAAAGILIGWYENTNGDPRPIMWAPCPVEDEEGVVTEKLKPGHLSTFESNNIGKALHSSGAGEVVGSAQVNYINESNTVSPEFHAFYRTVQCGIQDLNVLLAEPINDRSLILDSANYIATGIPPTPIIVNGVNPQTSENNTYILTPKPVAVDLEVKISSDHESLTVGDTHSIFIDVRNLGAVDNSASSYATCIFFRLTATVYSGETYEDRIKQARLDGVNITEDIEEEYKKLNLPSIADELVGGLTFDESYESTQDVVCNITRIDIVCAIERLDPLSAVRVTVKTAPRELLADRTIRTAVTVFATENETRESRVNNTAFELIDVERQACFIATAAYGSYLAPEVKILRTFRDDVLLQNTLGKKIVHLYYDLSPPLANYIHDKEHLRTVSRWLLTPIIYTISHPFKVLCLILGLLIIGLFHTRKIIFTHR